MIEDDKKLKKFIDALTERAKELNCIYKIEEILKDFYTPIDSIFQKIIKTIPYGWQYPECCQCRIVYKNHIFQSEFFQENSWKQESIIWEDDEKVGSISIVYIGKVAKFTENPFAAEEEKLLNNISERLGHYLHHKKLKHTVEGLEKAREELEANKKKEWKVITNLLKSTDVSLYMKIARKMLNYLCWNGVEKAKTLLQSLGTVNTNEKASIYDTNKPSEKKNIKTMLQFSDLTFFIASENISDMDILKNIHRWIKEEKLSFLIRTLENLDTTTNDLIDSISRYHHMEVEKKELSPYTKKNINVLLIHRFFTEQLEFIKIAKEYVEIEDFYAILQKTVYPNVSHGKLGGKSAGLFLADRILNQAPAIQAIKKNIKIPKTWYVTSDTLHHFIYYNNLEEIIEQKYKELDQLREEYPNIVQIFKHSHFPPEIIKGLSLALDDIGNNPIVVRSSSLLEDRVGAAFSGKYKSLFLANQGPKAERLNALMDAIAEVYASTFGPDPIEYRKERELLDFHEEMAIMIQEVVGFKAGNYFFPAFAGVAFSNNEYRWSPRIQLKDGLIRLVPGLGTRAVDRVSDDFPTLVSPGQPKLQVNASVEEMIRYSPKKMDVINLKTNTFETVDIKEILKTSGENYPRVDHIVSVVEDNRALNKSKFNIDFESDELIVTFHNLFNKTPFLNQIKMILDTLEKCIQTPIDIEFASDGENIYILQCRAQSYTKNNRPAIIPKNIPKEQILFTANQYISNGCYLGLSHIVYVVPEAYQNLSTREELNIIGRIVGKLNVLLPKRKFILIGPGRWGSRGDIKLGVNVTYSDINNTSLLIEVAMQKGNYVPELSFGTHFFQDLVEAGIKYLPLYPDKPDTIFNESFLINSPNQLSQILPDYSAFEHVVKVVDVSKAPGAKTYKVLMNSEMDRAVAYICAESTDSAMGELSSIQSELQIKEKHWKWRFDVAQELAERIKSKNLGVVAVYLIGSVKNATAGPASDIDLLVHFHGNKKQEKELKQWVDGWGQCLAELNKEKTGYQAESLIDLHIVTDEDIKQRTSFALKINAITDPARLLTKKN